MERPKVKDYDNISGAGAYDYVADVNRYMDYLEEQKVRILNRPDAIEGCDNWMPDKSTSATRCSNCGKDRWSHNL